MSLRLRCLALLPLICFVLSGCSPTPETQLDEQKNPHFQAGREKLSALDYKGAVESFERALEDNPRSALAHFELGVLFDEHENDYAAALYHYNKALKLRPNDHPADIIRQRIPACKQELVKTDSLSIINPTALRETERLREENLALRKQVELLQTQLVGRRPAAAAPAAMQRVVARGPAASSSSLTNTPAGTDPGSSGSARSQNDDESLRPGPVAAGRARTHTVKAGETPYSIARQYRVKLDSLMAANPGLDPKRIRAGQLLNVPSS
jgi:tetratricopeptide (TPR) repeat protein